MKKSLVLLLLVFLIGVFMGCTSSLSETSSLETSDPRMDILEGHYQDILAQVPNTIDSDLTLPNISQTGLDVSYFEGDQLLEDDLYIYESLSYDKEVVIKLELIYQGLTYENIISFTQLRDQNIVTNPELDSVFNTAFQAIKDDMPAFIGSDFSLPDIDVSGVVVSYESPDLQIIRNRLIYSFPQDSSYVIVRAALAYQGEIRTIDIPLRLQAIDQLETIPEIHINTTANTVIDSKESYNQATMDLSTNGMYQGIQEDFSGVRLGVRLRGNSTLNMPKKSYKIKFNQKRSMFGDYEEKDWVLLANYADQSLIRNYLANHLAEDLQMDFVPMSVFVDLYINGDYQGNYMLTDQIEVTNDRVDVEEGSSELNTGYLLEWDNRMYNDEIDHSGVNFFFIRGIPYVIKTPDWDDPEYSINQFYFIEDYMLTVYLTLQDQEDYSRIIDEASFIDWFIVNELFKNVDAGFSSIYFYKDKDERLKMGPVWDFDLSSGNAGHLDDELRGPEGWYTSLFVKNKLFYYLMEYPSFRANLKARWNEVYESHIETLLDEIHPIAERMNLSVYQNFERWDVLGENEEWYTSPEVLAIDSYQGQLWFLHDFLQERMVWMNQAINDLE